MANIKPLLEFQNNVSEEAAILQEYVERKKLFELLVDLNVEYDQVCVQVLRKKSFPSLSDVFSIIRLRKDGKQCLISNSSKVQHFYCQIETIKS